MGYDRVLSSVVQCIMFIKVTNIVYKTIKARVQLWGPPFCNICQQQDPLRRLICCLLPVN